MTRADVGVSSVIWVLACAAFAGLTWAGQPFAGVALAVLMLFAWLIAFGARRGR